MMAQEYQKLTSISQIFILILYFTVWGVEPVVTQISWLESTGACGVRQNQAVGLLFEQHVSRALTWPASSIMTCVNSRGRSPVVLAFSASLQAFS